MYKVMVVDDEIWTVKGIIASCHWGELGCKVVFDTTSPIEALNYMEENEVDIVLVDINMDEMNGLDLIKEARMKGFNVEFIIISGYSEFEYARSALQYGVFDYILKPVDRKILNDTIHNLVRSIQFKEDTHSQSIWMNIKKDKDDDKDESIQEILDYIQEHYHKNIYLSDLAHEFFYNQSYISSLFKKHLDKTFTEYLKDIRMAKACVLLLETEDSITDIANQVGYSDYCYFSKIFKKTYGITPLQYRKGR